MHECEGFLVADLRDEAGAATLQEALARPESLSDDVARGGWFCRFHSRLSPADVHYLESTLDLAVSEDADEALLGVMLDFRPGIALFMFALDWDGLLEFVLMPAEGATVGAEAIATAATDVLFGVVGAIGWKPRSELRRFSDEI
jgi:hypothetical protein